MSNRIDPRVPVNKPTRRQMIVGAAAAFGGLTMGSASVWADAEPEISHSAEAIHQEPVFKASRKRVYDALADVKQFTKIIEISGVPNTPPAEISREAGGPFTIFGGHIVGRHIELVPTERIVQAWRVVNWDAGHYSIARFELKEQGSETKIVFDHTGFPKGQAEHLASGWKEHYWEPLQKYLAGQS